ncbi:hypothetical protein [Microbacterium sp.]|nr:hypothetical protein [Microbacterium sp.]
MTSSTTQLADKPGPIRRVLAFPLMWLVIGVAAIALFNGLVTGIA